MTLTKEQREGMIVAAGPLIQWMKENCHPHCTAHVDQISVEVMEGIAVWREPSAIPESEP